MTEHVLLIGGLGSIGKRYQAICRYLNIPFTVWDVNESPPPGLMELSTRFLICSPTSTHMRWINFLVSFQKPILCEKPITRNIDDLERFMISNAPLYSDTDIRMVCNYEYARCLSSEAEAPTNETIINNYYTGNDGLYWDCIQLIEIANGPVYFNNTDPVWSLMINGINISREMVDESYVSMIRDWMDAPHNLWDLKKAYQAHRKVLDVQEKASKEGPYWCSGPIELNTIP